MSGIAAIPDPQLRVNPPRLTAEDLARLPSHYHCELIEGRLIHLLPPSHGHGWIAGETFGRLREFVRQHGLGRCYTETGFLVQRDPDTVRAPDVAFVRRERVPPPGPGYFPGTPDLAVEVVSPNDEARGVREKVQMWLDHGTTEVWVLQPNDRTVTIHGRAGGPVTFDPDATIDGGPLLPGFSCHVVDFFR